MGGSWHCRPWSSETDDDIGTVFRLQLYVMPRSRLRHWRNFGVKTNPHNLEHICFLCGLLHMICCSKKSLAKRGLIRHPGPSQVLCSASGAGMTQRGRAAVFLRLPKWRWHLHSEENYDSHGWGHQVWGRIVGGSFWLFAAGWTLLQSRFLMGNGYKFVRWGF